MKTILIQPGVKQSFGFRSIPISLMPLAGTLKDKGYEVEIFDARREDYHKLDLKDTLCVGITVLTGSQILHSLEISEYIKKKNPKIKIIWGGIHPSLLPKQTAENKLIDIVVKGEGELTLLELVEAFKKKKSIKNIKGIVYKENGKIIENPNRPFMDFNEAALHPYELIKNPETYEMDEIVHIQTSRGCPYDCGFCYNRNFNKYSYRFKSPERVIEEIEYVIKKLGVKRIHFDEDNFFVRKDRVKKIGEILLDKKINIIWSTTCRLDYLAKYDREFLRLIKKSGCKSLALGGESGSPRILKYIRKGITVEHIIKGIENAKGAGIKPIVSFVCGFPTETKKDVEQTLRLIRKLRRINKDFETNGIFIFTPYPKTFLFDEGVKLGFKEPKSLEGWGKSYFGEISHLPWMTNKYKKYIQAVSNVGESLYSKPNPDNFKLPISHLWRYFAKIAIYSLANIRFETNFYKLPLEFKLYERYTRRLK